MRFCFSSLLFDDYSLLFSEWIIYLFLLEFNIQNNFPLSSAAIFLFFSLIRRLFSLLFFTLAVVAFRTIFLSPPRRLSFSSFLLNQLFLLFSHQGVGFGAIYSGDLRQKSEPNTFVLVNYFRGHVLRSHLAGCPKTLSLVFVFVFVFFSVSWSLNFVCLGDWMGRQWVHWVDKHVSLCFILLLCAHTSLPKTPRHSSNTSSSTEQKAPTLLGGCLPFFLVRSLVRVCG